jgi:hypothetical protein
METTPFLPSPIIDAELLISRAGFEIDREHKDAEGFSLWMRGSERMTFDEAVAVATRESA